MISRFPLLQWIVVLLLGGVIGWYYRGAVEQQRIASVASVPVASPQQNLEVIAPPPPEALVKEKDGPKPPSDFGEVTGEMLATMDLKYAIEEGSIQSEFRGNYRDRLKMVVSNKSSSPLRLSLPLGQGFEGTGGRVILARPRVIDLLPGETRFEELATVAITSKNATEEGMFAPVSIPLGAWEALLLYAEEHPEISLPAIQTALLALVENLPTGAFAKFEGSSPRPAGINEAFRVETMDLIQALATLRAIGANEKLAIASDPQIQIEAMIDPMAHAAAMAFYQIPAQDEWAYWKRELLHGAPSTRHYALHGIARYFPEVALSMLPAWVREAKTSRIYRMTAIQALAATQRREALELLKTLEKELGGDAELGKAAAEAARYLEVALAEPDPNAMRIGYRLTKVVHEGEIEFVTTPAEEAPAEKVPAASRSTPVEITDLFDLSVLRIPSAQATQRPQEVSLSQWLQPVAL